MPWICQNPQCRKTFAEYINGCPACADKGGRHSVRWETDMSENDNLATIELTAEEFRRRARDCGWQDRTIELLAAPMLRGQHFGGAFAMGEKNGPHGRAFVIIKPPEQKR
jgi:hypothetical protein